MKFLSRLVNLKGELFSSTFTYGMTAVIRLGSSLVLTRLLDPEAYGIFGILLAFLFMLELLSDVGSTALLVRHERGDERAFVHTVWTVRMIRCVVNFCLVFFCAPLIASLYQSPILTGAFRVLSIWFLIVGAESMSFVLAQRYQRAKIANYADMLSNLVMSLFVIGLATIYKSPYVLIYGALLQRTLLTIASHFFYRTIGIGFALDREALRDQFRFARFVLPSSALTIVLTQYDKVVLLKLFNLSLLGLYGLSSNMLGPINGVNLHNARVILYARCTDYFRMDRATARDRYYTENKRLMNLGVALAALLAGSAPALVAILYDPRYAMVGQILTILSLGAIVVAMQNSSENLLVAYGRTHIVLVANLIRIFTVIPATLLGFYFFGFFGFLWFGLIATLPLLMFLFWEQNKFQLLSIKDELRRLSLGLLVFVLSFVASQVFLALIPVKWLHLGIKGH